MLPLKSTLESIKTLRALLSNSRQLLKKLDKTFKGKLRFPDCKQGENKKCIMLPLKNTLESIKTVGRCPTPCPLLKKWDKTFKRKLRFRVFVWDKVYCINKGRKTQKHYKNYSKFTVMLQDEQNYCIEKKYRL